MRYTTVRVFFFLCLVGSLFGCAGAPKNHAVAKQCQRGLNAAYTELDQAKVKGFGGSVNWTKAVSLLSAAKIQKEFGKHPNCVDKVKRARYYIRQSRTSR